MKVGGGEGSSFLSKGSSFSWGLRFSQRGLRFSP